MHVIHIKQTPLAWAPDEVVKVLQRYGKYNYYLCNYTDIIRTKIPPSEKCIIHFHNKYFNINTVPRELQLIQFHSEPFQCDINCNLQTKLVLNQYHCTLPIYKETCQFIVRNTCDVLGYVPNVSFPIFCKEKIKIVYIPSTTTRNSQHSDKGYIETLNSLKNIQQKYCEIVTIIVKTDIPYEQSIKEKIDAHIVIDECKTGSFHKSSIEGLTFGSIVFANISRELQEELLKTNKVLIPIENVKMDELECRLEEWILKGKEKIEEVAIHRFEVFNDNYGAKKVAEEFDSIYAKVFQDYDNTSNLKLKYFKNNLVINLSSRTDRWIHLQKEFEKIHIQPRRFEAIRKNDGAVGCSMSHIECLKIAIQNDFDTIFICEDDITFLDTTTIMRSFNNFCKEVTEWDVLLIGGNMLAPYNDISEYYYKVENCQSTIGYIIKKHYFKTLLSNFEEGVEQLKKTGDRVLFSIDMYWKKLQKMHNWYLLRPLTVTQWGNYSDVVNGYRDYNSVMLNTPSNKGTSFEFYSQYQQDKFVYETFFRNKKSGVFLEIGADDGIRFSNTYFFEKYLEWTGLCIESRNEAFTNLQKNRRCLCENATLSNCHQEVQFMEILGYGLGLSGIIDEYPKQHLERIKREIKNPQNKGTNILKVSTKTLSEILQKHDITHIDFLSIDTEGSELKILETVDFNKVHISVITIEDNYDDKSLMDFFRERNFCFVKQISCDKIFKNNIFS